MKDGRRSLWVAGAATMKPVDATISWALVREMGASKALAAGGLAAR